MKQIRKPIFEKANIVCLRDTAQKIYDEIIQWDRWEDGDTSEAKRSIFCLGHAMDDMAYHGWVGEPAKKESEKYDALRGAYRCLLATVEDLLGIKKDEWDSELNDKGEVRYQIVDTGSDE